MVDPEFNKDTLSYTVEVDNEVEEITVLGLATSNYAKVDGNGKYTLSEGNNEINLVVTAENGDIRTYKLNVVRKGEPSSKLIKLRAQEGVLSPTFDKNTVDYSITVPTEVTSLTLEIEKEDPNATYEVTGNSDFRVGSNIVEITVTSTEGVETVYTLTVIRQTASNNYLKTLDLGYSYTPEFNRTTQYYELEVDKNTDTIVVNGEAEDSRSTVSIWYI